MRKESRTWFKVAVAIFLIIGLATTGSAFGIDDKQNNQEFNELIDKISPTNPALLDKLIEKETVLKAYGKIPDKTNGKEVYNWMQQLNSIRVSINKDNSLDMYLYPNGPITAYGVQRDGYFHVLVYTDKYDIKEEDYSHIINIINMNDEASEISELPIVFTTGTPINLTAVPPFPNTAPGYDLSFRPIQGGILGGFYSTVLDGGDYGTIGFAAERISDGQKGFVTAGHLVNFDTNNSLNYSAYQPEIVAGNYLSNVYSVGANTDAVFFSYDNVVPAIHTGNGLGISVDGYYEYVMSNMLLRRSGAASGFQTGTYFGTYTGQSFNGVPMDCFEAMENACLPGDSGAPVYYTYNGRNKLVGTVMGSANAGGTWVTAYIPCREIISKLGVEPLEN